MRITVLLLFAAIAIAGDGGLSGIDGLLLPVSPPRSGRPVVVEVRLSSRLGAREGQAIIVLKADDGEAARWEGPVWRVGSEPTVFRVLLPPPRGWEGYDDLRAELSWREGALDLPLARQVLARAGLDTRAVAELSPAGIEVRRDAVMPLQPSDGGEQPAARVSVVRLDPADAAVVPEAWQAWDAVLLHPQTALPPPVAGALATWVLAGGRLMLAPGRPGPEVDGLLGALDAGRGAVRTGDGWISWRSGLGLVVRDEGGEAEAIALALWGRPAAPVHRWHDVYQPERDLGQLLWPEAVGRVPLSLVLLVFAGFLLWVGPVEWIVLGRLRRRRWTWITFPLAAVAATIAVTAIARGAFGSADHVRRLVLVDCDVSGAARCCNIIEQRFAGGDRMLEEQPQGELVTPVEIGERWRGDGTAVRIRTVHRGPWHAGGSVEIALPQWTPVLLRRYSTRLPAGLPTADFGPAPSPEAAASGLAGLLQDGWRWSAVTPGEHEAGDDRVFAGPRREGFASGEQVWDRLRRGLAGPVRGALAGLANPRPCRMVARQQGGDIIVWRQELPMAEQVDDEPETGRKKGNP
jgi:hypothetical protein